MSRPPCVGSSVDVSKIDKIRKLIAMATNDATTPEEARTFALTAITLIVSEKIELRDPGLVGAGPSQVSLDELLKRGDERLQRDRRWPDAGPTPRARPVRRADGSMQQPAGSDTMITTRAAGFCAECKDAFPKGARMVWRKATQDLAHLACHTSDRAPEPPPG